MSEDVKVGEGHIDEEIYKQGKFFWLRNLIVFFCIFAIALSFNFPLKKIITTQINTVLSKNKACPISYGNLDFSLILPKIILNKLRVPARCFNGGADLIFSNTEVGILFPSFWPIGIKLFAEAKIKKTILKLYPRITFDGSLIKIDNSIIDGSFIAQLVPNIDKIMGQIKVQGLVGVNKSGIEDVDILAKSTNLSLPAQRVSSFDLPPMNFNIFELKASQIAKKLNISNFTLGDLKSPIQIIGNGSINLNKKNFQLSLLDLKAKIKFSEPFKKQMPILNILIGNRKLDKDGFYQVEIKGVVAQPKPNFL